MLYQAHRGVCTEFPENTMPAFLAAVKQGYSIIELEPGFTADKKCVITHDKTLVRTCRLPDGSMPDSKLKLSSVTYDQLMTFDAGIFKGKKFKGTKVPLLSDVLALSEKYGVHIKLDNKIWNFSPEELNILFETVKAHNADIGFTCSSIEQIRTVLEVFPRAVIHFDGAVTDETEEVLRLLDLHDALVVWMCLDVPEAARATVPKADPDICKKIRSFARLGIQMVSTYDQLCKARDLGADIIDTPGQIKPKNRLSGFADCHVHSLFSHDSASRLPDIMKAADLAGLSSVALCDHCDIENINEPGVLPAVICSGVVSKSGKDVSPALFSGIEIGEAIWNSAAAEKCMAVLNPDIVLGSVHAVRSRLTSAPYSTVDFIKFTTAELNEYFGSYLDDIEEMTKSCDFDVLSHLTCPLRYIVCKYNIPFDISPFYGRIDDILKEIIKRGAALEVNTSCLCDGCEMLMPDKYILAAYRSLGGYLITLGSDAHAADRVGFGFKETAKTLSSIGYRYLYYYDRRIPIQYSIDYLI